MPSPTISPHASLNELLRASQGNGNDQFKSASRNRVKTVMHPPVPANGSGNNSPNQNSPQRPSLSLNRRSTTGNVTTQERSEKYASLQQTAGGPIPGAVPLNNASTTPSPSSSPAIIAGMENANVLAPTSSTGIIAGTNDSSTAFNHASWSAGANSPIRKTASTGMEFAHSNHQASRHIQQRRFSCDTSKMPIINNIHTGSQTKVEPRPKFETSHSPSDSYVNPFEDPAIIGDLTQPVPLTQLRSFPGSTGYHPLQHLTSITQTLNAPGEQFLEGLLSHRPPGPTHVRASTTGHIPQPISDPTSTSASHKHSVYDPLLNTQLRSSMSTDDLRNSTVNPTHFQSATLDIASLADIAAQLATMKPQKQDPGLEKKNNHLLTLGAEPEESTGTKKSHKRFLSQPFLRKSVEDGDDKNGHRRSISAGLAAVFKRGDDGDKDVTRSITPVGGRGRGKKGSPVQGTDGAGSSERPITPVRRKGLNLRRSSRPERNTEALSVGLEVIQSGSGEDLSTNIEIKMRSSEQDPSPHQISIPAVSDVLYPAKLCQLLEQYRVIDQNFAFDSLVGMTRAQMHHFLQEQKTASKMRKPASPDSSRLTSPLSSGSPVVASSLDQVSDLLTSQQQQLMETHVPIVASLFDADDLLLEGFYHEVCDASKNKAFDTSNEKSTRDRVEVAIFKNDTQRQFIVVYQGCAESQMKPIKKGEQKDGIDRRFQLGRKDDDKRFSEEQPVAVFPPFRKCYFNSEVEDKVFTKLDYLVEQHPFFDVVMTGHSFGGVLALLSSMRYANMRPQIMTSCFAFGCPKIGAIDFRYYVNSLPNLRVMRLEYGCDPWTNAPDHPNWCHAGHTIAIKYNETTNADKLEGSDELIVRAFKFGDNRPDSGGREGKRIGKILSRQTNKEKQMDHDIASYIHALKQIAGHVKGSVGLWPRRFVGEEGTGVEGLDKEKRSVC